MGDVVKGPPSTGQGQIVVQVQGNGPAIEGSTSDLTGTATGFLGGAASFGKWAGFAGVYGTSSTWIGVLGISQGYDGIHGRTSSAAHAGVSGVNESGGIGVFGAGGTAGFFAGAVTINGNTTVNGNLTMGSGGDLILADCAEEFEYAGASPHQIAGSVMVLDQTGMLRPCAQPYDTRAIGVVSGAGRFRPAIVLDRREGGGHRAPIALMGKVVCKADAAFGAIAVGDLLTTSPTRGHAMRASDPSQAFGAVIGKAIEALLTGRGEITILVTLQ